MWTSYYNAGLSKQVVRQLLAVINRDTQAALDFVSGVPGSYAPFVEYDLALLPVQQFPAILLTPDTVAFEEEATLTLHQTMRLSCVIALTHQDRNTLAEIAQDYVRAVRAVLDTLWESITGRFPAHQSSLTLAALPERCAFAGTGERKAHEDLR